MEGYNTKRMRINWTDHTTLLCIRACNVEFSVFVGLVNKCADVVIGLTPSCSRQVKGDGRKVKQSELELHCVPQCLNLSAAILYGLIFVTKKRTNADLNSQQLKHFALPPRTQEIVFPMTYISKFLGGRGGRGGNKTP